MKLKLQFEKIIINDRVIVAVELKQPATKKAVLQNKVK